MSEVDPLAEDTVLVIFGTVLGVFAGMSWYTSGSTVSVTAVAVGVVFPLLVVGAVAFAGTRVSIALEVLSDELETRRGRVILALVLAGASASKFFVTLSPAVDLAVATASVTTATVGLGRIGYRVQRED